jgi:ElaB/YqjD/DUF883 family membrane-anchored ribosome-binding protein
MANEQDKQTQNTSFGTGNQSTGTENQSTDFSKTNQTKSTEFGSTETGNKGLGSTASSNTGSTGFSTGSTESKSGTTDLSMDSAKETAKGLYDQAKSTVGQAYGAATKRATEALDEQKGTVASGLTSVADSIKQVGENLNTSPEHNKITETAAKYTNSLAEQIENISGYFERKDVRDMVRDVETFARRNPAYFIGGAVALGFLAARFLKSSNPNQLRSGAGRTFNEDRDRRKSLAAGNTTPGSSQF